MTFALYDFYSYCRLNNSLAGADFEKNKYFILKTEHKTHPPNTTTFMIGVNKCGKISLQ